MSQTSSPDDLDSVRQKHPHFRYAVYAYEPGGPVTLEIITPGDAVYTWSTPTLAEAIALAFPPAEEPAAEADIFG